MPVGLVLVSHSARIAEGVVEVAAQMAPDVRLVPAGGTDDGGIGTSFARVDAAIRAADQGHGVLLIGDLGSAILTAETVVELLEEPPSGGVRVLDVPIVEGGVAAAVAAQAGGSLDEVAAAARGDATAEDDEERLEGIEVAADVELADPEGLHARPAAALVRAAARFASRVTVDGADATNLLAVLALGLRQGARVDVRATGPDASAALAEVTALLGSAEP